MAAVVCLFVFAGLILIVAYNMIDGRNRIIQFLQGNLDASKKSLDKAKLAYDAVETERDKALNRLQQERIDHSKALKARDERITKIVNSLAHLEWDREHGDRYRLMISFDPRMVWYGGGAREDREFLARDLADQVFCDIVSSKFVESAEQRRREWEAKHRRPYTF